MEKLNFGDVVIIDMNNQSPQKVKVLEVTEKTYLLANLDQRKPIVESLGANYIINTDSTESMRSAEEIMKEFKNQRMTMVKRDEDCEYVTFRISISTFNLRYKVIEFICNRTEQERKMLEAIINVERGYIKKRN